MHTPLSPTAARLRQHIPAVLLVLMSTGVLAQKPLPAPNIETCEGSARCEVGIGKLSPAENAKLQELLQWLSPNATESQITQALKSNPFEVTPPIRAFMGPSGTMLNKGLWWVGEKRTSELDPHVDVLFVNGKAAMFTWWMAGLKKHVKVELSQFPQ
jgi:hypothetical protein